jgi:hypothetical protein
MTVKMKFFLWVLGMLLFTSAGLAALFVAVGDYKHLDDLGKFSGVIIVFLIVYKFVISED